MPEPDPNSLAVVWQIVAHPGGVYVEEILGPGRARSIGPLPDRPAAQALIERLRAEIDGVITRSQQDIRPLSPVSAPASA